MKTLANILWVIFGGILVALEYFVASLLLIVTIVGIPFGLQTIKLGLLAFWPFGAHVEEIPSSSGCLNLIMNIIWLIIGGIWIALSHVILAAVFCITIIGIPFGVQHFKLALLALFPFGKQIIRK
jgi:uncharacterized membrane protein YccF (DUF307 family)